MWAAAVCWGGGGYQIDDVTLPSSQAECDPRLIAPLLFCKRSETLWSLRVCIVFQRLQRLMLRCGNGPPLFIASRHGPREVREVWQTNIESVRRYARQITAITCQMLTGKTTARARAEQQSDRRAGEQGPGGPDGGGASKKNRTCDVRQDSAGQTLQNKTSDYILHTVVRLRRHTAGLVSH